MRIPVIILSIVAALLSSCATDTKTDTLVRIVEEWKGKTILMPDSLSDFLTGTGAFENHVLNRVLISFHSFDNPVILQLSGVVAN